MKFFSSLRYSVSVLSLVILTMLNPQLSYAADDDEPAPCSGSGVDCLIGGYGTQVLKQMARLPKEGPIITDTWPAQSGFFKTPTLPITILDSQKALETLFQSPGNPETNQPTANLLYAFNFSGGAECPNPNTSSAKESCKIPADKTLNNINFNTFFGPLTYDATQEAAAKNFLQLSALTAQPFPLTNIADILKDKNDFVATTATPEYQKYLSLLRLYATVQSTALSNLYQFYNERLPYAAKKDGEKSVDKDGKELDTKIVAALKAAKLEAETTSPLQLENYMATHRLTEMGTDKDGKEVPKWLFELMKDNTAMLQRQMLILQAENLAETHRLRMSIDRLTATTSMMMLQNSYNMRQQLESVAGGIKPSA